MDNLSQMLNPNMKIAGHIITTIVLLQFTFTQMLVKNYFLDGDKVGWVVQPSVLKGRIHPLDSLITRLVHIYPLGPGCPY